MKQTQRHHEILALLDEQGFLSTEAFVETFNVSPQTIRRDLNELAKQGLISRHHGGASLYSSTENEAYSTRKVSHQEEKARIAAELVKKIPNGSSLFIDIGTTTEAVATALLNHKDLKVVTNNINVASILMAKEDFTVIIAGGQIRNKDGGIIGEATREFIEQFRMDFGIIGISGIDSDGSLLDFDYSEVKIAQAIIASSRQTLLAADSSKFNRGAMVNLGHISQVDSLFTDEMPAAELVEVIKQHEVELLVC
ncbi:Glycerol-3-phosphate regulon repressor [Vibrio nigripulchritudo MADA3029]|uniref:Glycerol-3-phosphate regulon repressor n=2 Tax=Vibrio nigripulchritudo TaxID=28173 RepID=U4K843_9VIBR|nr:MULTISPECIES: DeoR/GlpR family transcriptional regulator [Vibrio]EGU55805.1 glycerol-3-phosphate regulon repressor [Vibrio nigripulchritudo ATCC 27043]KJY78738.1 transcriptional regulator [Vibrio nigripulchritudo]UAB72976.1 DeoR/GlpR family transcriptional regulator [Vibrio sp. SCSIO 43132]CCN36555.1 Glycerol-3-phosphate regulon repressor [Vibrio nigripulchritudo AM115]CCN43631.1 Glycerol-3-phosphate regulon repressor [Vibrio nigripulchritudo FTn2]